MFLKKNGEHHLVLHHLNNFMTFVLQKKIQKFQYHYQASTIISMNYDSLFQVLVNSLLNSIFFGDQNSNSLKFKMPKQKTQRDSYCHEWGRTEKKVCRNIRNSPSAWKLNALNRASDISRGRGPRNSGFPAKSREIPRNPPEIFPDTCRQNIFHTYLGYYTCFIHPKHPNLSWNFVTATSKQRPKTTRRFRWTLR